MLCYRVIANAKKYGYKRIKVKVKRDIPITSRHRIIFRKQFVIIRYTYIGFEG